MAKIMLVFSDAEDGAIEFELITPKGERFDETNLTPAQEVAIETYETFQERVKLAERAILPEGSIVH